MIKRFIDPSLYLCLAASLVLLLSACSAAATPIATQPLVTLAATTAVPLPSATATSVPPTATTAATTTAVPSATMTASVTPTPIPPLAVLPDGFFAWCNPTDYAFINLPGAIAPETSNQLTHAGDTYQVKIPAEYCVLVFTLNQPAPQGLTIEMFNNGTSFQSLPAMIDTDHPQMAYAVVRHPYVIDPPFWQVTYRAAIAWNGADLRSELITFARPVPSNCPYGGLPDPVTLKCAASDPWEMEPHPGIVYPYPTFTPEANEAVESFVLFYSSTVR